MGVITELTSSQCSGDAVPWIGPAPHRTQRDARQDEEWPRGADDQCRRQILELVVHAEPPCSDRQCHESHGQRPRDPLE
jgi:hypothetical protein